jgi:hypothetical protein
MMSPDAGLLRLARASGFGLVAFSLSLTAHVAGGGQLPSAMASLVLLGACCWVSVFLTWRRLGRLAAVIALGVMQVLLHAALMLASAAGACTAMMSGHPHLSTATAMAAPVCLPGPAHEPSHAGGWPAMGMTLAHAAAAVLLGVLLSRADRAVWFLATLRLWAPPADVRVSPPVAAAPLVPAVPAWCRSHIALLGVRRRGPPVAAAPALG